MPSHFRMYPWPNLQNAPLEKELPYQIPQVVYSNDFDKYPEGKTSKYASGKKLWFAMWTEGERILQTRSGTRVAACDLAVHNSLVASSTRGLALRPSHVLMIHFRTGRCLAVPVVVVQVLGVVLEVGVVASLLGRDAAGGVVDEHHLEEIETGVIEVLAEGLGLIADPLGEGSLEVRVRGNTGPDVLGRGTKQAVGKGKSVSLGLIFCKQ